MAALAASRFWQAVVVSLVLAAPAGAAEPRAKVETRGHVTVFSLTVQEAREVARVCDARGAAVCGDLITGGDGPQLEADCGASAARLGELLRTAARAVPTVSRVELRTENGGYPYICAFRVRTERTGWCDRQRISQPELDALPLFERMFALIRAGFCVGPGWIPDLGG